MRLTDKVLRAIRWDTLGSVAVSGITFATTVWMVRALGPSRYGMLAALLAFLGLAQLIASGGARYLLLRFVPKAMKEEGPGGVARVLQQAVVSRAGLLLVLSLPLFFFPREAASLVLGRPDLARYLRYVPLLVAPPLVADLLSATLIALFRQPTVRLSELCNKTAFAAGLIGLPLWNDPIYGVFAAWVAGWLVGLAFMALAALRGSLMSWPSSRRQGAARRWLRFSGAAYGLTLIGYILGRELDILLLTRLGVRSEVLAQYAVCFGFVTLVYRLPMLPISGGFEVPLIAELYGRGDKEALRRVFRASVEYIYLFVLPLMGGGLIVGTSWLSAIYGESYGRASVIYIPLLVLLGLTKVAGVTGSFLMATDREGASLRVRMGVSALNVVLALVAIPRYGAAGAAWATGLTMAGLVVWEGALVHKLLHPRYPWPFLGRVSLAVSVMMGLTYGLASWWGTPLHLVPLLGITFGGGLGYVAMLLWLRPVAADHAQMLEGIGIPWVAPMVARLCRPMPSSAGEEVSS